MPPPISPPKIGAPARRINRQVRHGNADQMNQRQPQGDRECRWIALKDVLSKTSSACGTSGSRELCRGGVPHERHACRLMGLDDRRITIGREKRISGAREKLEIFLLG